MSENENVTKSAHSASFLVQDLRELVKANNPLLADLALDLLENAVKIEQRLKRLEMLLSQEEGEPK